MACRKSILSLLAKCGHENIELYYTGRYSGYYLKSSLHDGIYEKNQKQCYLKVKREYQCLLKKKESSS